MRTLMLLILASIVLFVPHLSPSETLQPTSAAIENGMFFGLIVMFIGLVAALLGLFLEELQSLATSFGGAIIYIVGLGIYVFYAFPI